VPGLTSRSWRPALATALALALATATARRAEACGCCDGTSEMAPVGWNAKGDGLLLRNEEHRGCARRVALQVRPVDGKGPASCFDLLGDPDKRVACKDVGHDWERKPRSSKEEQVYARSVAAVGPEAVRARYTVTHAADPQRQAKLDVSLLGSAGWTTVHRWTGIEYPYAPENDDPATLFPLEVSLWPVPARPATYAVVIRGFDEAPGTGHRGWALGWVRTPAAAGTAAGEAPSGGVSWIRAVPTPASLSWEPERAGGLNTRGVKALAAGDARAAVTHFEDALRHAPAHVLARYNLACAEAKSGWQARALATFTELMTTGISGRARAERKQRAQVDADLASLRPLPAFRKLVCDKACPPAWDAPPSP
jgi:hypothetical protein